MRAIVGLAAWIVAATAGAAGPEWPQFRGPDGQGHATARGVPTAWSENENVVWKVPIAGLGWSSPVVRANQIWLTTAVEEQGSLRAVCLDRQTGSVLHDVEVFKADDLGRVNAKNSHASPTPVLDEKYVFVHFGNHGTACLDMQGQVLWRVKLDYDHRHGPGGSAVLWQDLLVVSCDGPDVQYTVALDKRTGKVRWKAEHAGEQAYATPLLIEVDGQEQLVTSGGNNLIAYQPRDGQELWRFRHNGHSVIPRPVFGNGLLYFCTGYWNPSLLAVRPDGQGDVSDSHQAFAVRRSVPHTPSPLLAGELLLMLSDQGVMTCLDPIKGKEIWRERLGGNISASPTLVDGRVYVVREDASTLVIAPSGKCQVLATNQLEGRALASPAFVGRAIFLRTDTHLYRIEEPRNVRASATISRRDTPTALR